MRQSTALLWLAIASATEAAQPGAAQPVESPMRNLTWGQLNFLHTTDTHGWLAGHLQEPQYAADWGDYISFSQHMRKRADDAGVDLLLVDTGDRVDGNGLYDASKPKGLYTYDIFREQDVDIICTGNHELYLAETAEREHLYTVPNFKDNYIASNLDYRDPKSGELKPMAQRYKKIRTKNLGLEIVAFGFLFDFLGNANNTVVYPVEAAVEEAWFQKAIREKADVFVVLGHVGLRMDEFKRIYAAIRKQNPHTPIAFFGGHAHVRDAVRYDPKAYAMASGRYLETVGWMSLDDIKRPREEDVADEKSVSFTRKYIDNNLFGYYYHSGMTESSFPTKRGRMVTDMIRRARESLDLDYKFGCAPRDLWTNRAPYPSDASIFTWLETELLPDVISRRDRTDKSRIAILNTGGIRFDIFKGTFTKDSTYLVSPFVSKFAFIPDVPYSVASRVASLLNNGGPIFNSKAPDIKYLGIPQQWDTNISQAAIDRQPPERKPELRGMDSEDQHHLADERHTPDLISGYTTRDDISDTGDDTVHSHISFYSVPNCIEAKIGFPDDGAPDTVDLVFIDFILPWILVALKFSGGDYSAKDVRPYLDGTFTYYMAEWIKANWRGDC